MHLNTSLAWMAANGLALGAITGAASADVDERDRVIESLQGRVAQLEDMVSRMHEADGEEWMTEARAEQIRHLVSDVLADADQRRSLLQGGPIAGWDKGFFLASPDGNFALKVEGQIQVRFGWDNRDGSSDDDRWGFELRRTKLTFKGHVVDPTWQYVIQGAFNRDTRSYLTGVDVDFDEDDVSTTSSSLTGPFELEDAYVVKELSDNFYVQFGQFKLPFLREEMVSSKRQLAVERSLVGNAFSIVRSQGVMLGYEADMFRVMGAYSDGARMANGSFLSYDTEYSFTGRAEVLLAGSWKQHDDFTSWRGEEFALLLGGALHYQAGEFGTTATEMDTFSWTVDASAEFGGANLYGAVIGRHIDMNTTGRANPDQIGFIIQGGVFVADEWEVFGRFEWGDDDIAGNEELSILTLGVNKYFSKHQLKWSTDIGLAFDEVESTWSTSGAGWQSDAAGQDGQLVLRSQFQLLF